MRFSWKKTLLLTCDIALGVYLIAAFTAFNKPDETNHVCSKVNIDIQDEATNETTPLSDVEANGTNQLPQHRGRAKAESFCKNSTML